MRNEYDFSKLKARRNPHARKLKKQGTQAKQNSKESMNDKGWSIQEIQGTKDS